MFNVTVTDEDGNDTVEWVNWPEELILADIFKNVDDFLGTEFDISSTLMGLGSFAEDPTRGLKNRELWENLMLLFVCEKILFVNDSDGY